MRLAIPNRQITLLLILTGLVLTVEWWAASFIAASPSPTLLATAISVDIIVGLPVLFYLFLVRPGHVSKAYLSLVFAGAVLLAKGLLPAEHESVLIWLEYVLPLVELAIIAYLVFQARAIRRAYRVLRPSTVYASDAAAQAVAEVVGTALVFRLAITEAQLFYYSVVGWFVSFRPTQPDHRPFTIHRRTIYPVILVFFTFIMALETLGIHLLIAHWTVIGAWIVTALSIYTFFWILGDFNAIRLHPIVVTEDDLHLRVGLRWRAVVPRQAIVSLSKISRQDAANKEILRLILIGEPNCLLELDREITFYGLFGRTRTEHRVVLAVDEAAELIQALAQETVSAETAVAN